jgi:hypothetical protein
MKAQNLCITCTYNDDGVYIQNIILSSFSAFLKRELEKFASKASGHV